MKKCHWIWNYKWHWH